MTVTALQVVTALHPNVTALHPKRNGVTSDARLHVARKTKHYDDWDALVWGPLSTKRWMTVTASQRVTASQGVTASQSSTARMVDLPRARSTGCIRGMFVSDTQLRGLEERGYLDTDLRGNRVDEADAIETAYWFITVREQPSIQPSISWIAKSFFEPVSTSTGRQNSRQSRLS
jgi:hypothetical protein